MSIYVRDQATDDAVRKLAKLKGLTITETVRMAAERVYEEDTKQLSLLERIRPIQERLAKYPRTGLEADKAFYDELSGDI